LGDAIKALDHSPDLDARSMSDPKCVINTGFSTETPSKIDNPMVFKVRNGQLIAFSGSPIAKDPNILPSQFEGLPSNLRMHLRDWVDTVSLAH
jgi:hypothetical protein